MCYERGNAQRYITYIVMRAFNTTKSGQNMIMHRTQAKMFGKRTRHEREIWRDIRGGAKWAGERGKTTYKQYSSNVY